MFALSDPSPLKSKESHIQSSMEILLKSSFPIFSRRPIPTRPTKPLSVAIKPPPPDFNFRSSDLWRESRATISATHPELSDLADDGRLVLVQKRRYGPVPAWRTEFDEPEAIWLVGTSHISDESAANVERVVKAVKPDNVVVELCRSRQVCVYRAGIMYTAVAGGDEEGSEMRSSVFSLSGDGFFGAVGRSLNLGGQTALALRLLLAMFSSKISSDANRPFGNELERAWKSLKWSEKLSLLTAVVRGITSSSTIPTTSQVSPSLLLLADDSTLLKLTVCCFVVSRYESNESFRRCLLQVTSNDDDLDTDASFRLYEQLSFSYPSLLHPLIHERDTYLAWSLKRSKAVNHGKNVVGVIGKGHMNGVVYALVSDLGDLRFRDLVGDRTGGGGGGSSFVNATVIDVLKGLVRDTVIGVLVWQAYELVKNSGGILWREGIEGEELNGGRRPVAERTNRKNTEKTLAQLPPVVRTHLRLALFSEASPTASPPRPSSVEEQFQPSIRRPEIIPSQWVRIRLTIKRLKIGLKWPEVGVRVFPPPSAFCDGTAADSNESTLYWSRKSFQFRFGHSKEREKRNISLSPRVSECALSVALSRSFADLSQKMRPIFCGNFEYDARQSELERLFKRYGRVERIDMKSGFAFIYMEDERDAEDAIRGLDRIEFGRKGRRLRVEWTKQERGARGGGGGRGGGSKRSANTRPSKTLFVINFDPNLTRTRDLERHFESYGKITSVRIRRNFAFVQYEAQEDAIKALEATNLSKLMDRVISVEYAARDDDERKDGGGGYSPDRARDRSPRKRSVSPYRRDRGSPDYGRGPRERGSPDYGGRRVRSPSPSYKKERSSPVYGRRGRSPSPYKKGGRSSPDYPRESSRSPPYKRERAGSDHGRGGAATGGGSRSPYHRDRANPDNGRRSSPYQKDREDDAEIGNGVDHSPDGRETGEVKDDHRSSRSPYERDDARSPSNGRRTSPTSMPEDDRDSPNDARADADSPIRRDRYSSRSPPADE
ncbi:Serine/arginine-rich splicing factor RS40 [Linum perenne]